MNGRRPSWAQRQANRVLTRMLRRGKGPAPLELLTVRGRATGRQHSTPIVPVHRNGKFLVAAYGPVDWVRNARAAGNVTLQRGDEMRTYDVVELDPRSAIPVLRTYLEMPTARYVRKLFDVGADASDEALEAAAHDHPVFALSERP